MSRIDLTVIAGAWRLMRQERDGYPIAEFTSPEGKRVTRRFLKGKSREEGIQWCERENQARTQRAEDAGNPVLAAHRASAKETIRSAIGRRLVARAADKKLGNISEATLAIDTWELGHWKRLEGDTLLSASLLEVWRRYRGKRADEGASFHTLRKEAIAMRAALKDEYRAGRLARDPSLIITNKEFEGCYSPCETVLTEAEAWRLVLYFQNAPRSKVARAHAAHVASFLAWGWRKSEAARAVRDDIHVDTKGRQYILIRSAKVKKRNRANAKKKAERYCWFTRAGAEFAKFALEHAPGKMGERLFLPWPNMPRDLRVAATALQIGQHRGIRDERGELEEEWWSVSRNDLRRTMITLNRIAGMPREELAEMVGNSSQMIKMVYERVPLEDRGDAIAAWLAPAGKPDGSGPGAAKVISLPEIRKERTG